MRTKPRNITLDAETQADIAEIRDHLTKKLGFRPSLPQVVRHMVAVTKRNIEEGS